MYKYKLQISVIMLDTQKHKQRYVFKSFFIPQVFDTLALYKLDY